MQEIIFGSSSIEARLAQAYEIIKFRKISDDRATISALSKIRNDKEVVLAAIRESI